MKLPILNIRGWMSVVAIGASTGCVTLIAAWMFASNRKLVVWPIGLLCCLLAGVALSQVEWFAHIVVRHADWPPDPPALAKLVGSPVPLPIAWPLTLPTMAMLLLLILLVYSLARHSQRIAARIGVAALIVLVAALPLNVLWRLLNPRPIPEQQLPQPNGYDELVAAGKAFNSSPILNTTVQPTSTAQLAAEIAKFAPSFDRVRFALTLPCEVPITPTIKPNMSFSFPFDSVQTIRSVARALNCKAELAQQQGNFHDAAWISIDNIRVGDASARGGIVPHYLVGVAVQGVGMAALHQAASHLDAPECDEIIAALEAIDNNREPLEAIIERDRVYCENAWGWYGHLILVLDDIANDHPGYWATKQATLRSTTVRRLLTMELALRQYRLDTGALADRLEVLVPNYASRLPTDPYDAENRDLRYARAADGYLLYSVGYDGDDDGGRPSSRDEGWFDDGDMWLDAYFEPETATVAVSADGGEEEADESEAVDDENASP
jgi:hypothetical protein